MNYLKTIVAVLAAGLAIAHAFLTREPGGPIDWQALVNAVIAPLLVYITPNLPKDPPVVVAPPVAPLAAAQERVVATPVTPGLGGPMEHA